MKLKSKSIGAGLFIAGTAIGAGMLSLPISLGVGGIIGATAAMMVGFLYMLITLFLQLEILCYQESGKTLIGVSYVYLGRAGELITWGSFLCLLYLASAAYINGAVDLMTPLGHFFHLDSTLLSITFSFVVGLACTFGLKIVDHLNRFLMFSLTFSFLALVYLITPSIHLGENLMGEPKYLIVTAPLIVLSFTSHIVLPSARVYLEDNIEDIKAAMIIGSITPLVFYLVWIYLIVMLLPFNGDGSIMELTQLKSGHLAYLSQILENGFAIKNLRTFYDMFSYFAIITSFLGVTIAIADSIEDGLGLANNPYKDLIKYPMTLIPPLIVANLSAGFITVLNYGGIFVVLLLGIIPAIISWIARYRLKQQSSYTLPGGKSSLITIAAIGLVVIMIVYFNELGLLPRP